MLIKREAFKTFYNGLEQKMKDFRGNWEQNDPTADDYIKNRPFYTETGVEIVVLPETSFTEQNANGVGVAQLIISPALEIGKEYRVVFDDTTYSCVAYEHSSLSGFVVLGNFTIVEALAGVTGATDTGEPFIFASLAGVVSYIYTTSVDSHTLKIVCVGESVKKIDEKYLPTMNFISYNKSQDLTEDQMAIARENIGAGTSSFSGSYADLTNKPTIYTDVVRYNSTQSLSDTHKAKARSNIGAISKDEAVSVIYEQSLTDTQKALARKNIGASAFDGSFESLTDVPSLMTLDTEQNAANRKVLNFGQTQSVDGSMCGLEINTCMWKGTSGEVNCNTLLGNGSFRMTRTNADGTSQEVTLLPGMLATGKDTIEFQRHSAINGQSVRIINLLAPIDYHDAAHKGYVDSAIAAMQPKSTSVTLQASEWLGDSNPWYQEVSVNGVTTNSKVDLQPTALQIIDLQNNDIALIAENDNGVVTVYAIGGKPTVDYTMQALITEVTVV